MFSAFAGGNQMDSPNGPVANMLTNPGPPGLVGRQFGAGGMGGQWQSGAAARRYVWSSAVDI